MAGPYHGQHEGRRNDARRLLRERLQREELGKYPWTRQPAAGMTALVFMLVVVAMFAVVWLTL